MRCHGQKCEKIENGSFQKELKYLGVVKFSNINYQECVVCGERYFKLDGAYDRCVEEHVNTLLSNLPRNQFIDSKTTADMLGISKQALSQSDKYSTIWQVREGRNVMYVKKSVELFVASEDGEGRFDISVGVDKTGSGSA